MGERQGWGACRSRAGAVLWLCPRGCQALGREMSLTPAAAGAWDE